MNRGDETGSTLKAAFLFIGTLSTGK